MKELKRLEKILNIELALIIFFMIAGAGGAFFILDKHNSMSEEMMVQRGIGEKILMLKDIIFQQDYYGNEFRRTGREEYAEKFLSSGQQFDSVLKTLKTTPVLLERSKISADELNDLLNYHNQFQTIYFKIFENIRQEKDNLEIDGSATFKNKIEETTDQWQAFSAKKILNLDQEMKQFVRVVLLSLFIFFLFLSIGFTLILRGFFAPLTKKLLGDLDGRAKALEEAKESLEETKNVLEIRVKARTRELKELTEGLENQIQERTKKFQEKIKELERFQRLTLGRELRMIDLKKEIKKIKEKLEPNNNKNTV